MALCMEAGSEPKRDREAADLEAISAFKQSAVLGLKDAEEAIKLCPTNVKELNRAVKASLSLNMLAEANFYCNKALKQSPDNEDLKKLSKQIDSWKSEMNSVRLKFPRLLQLPRKLKMGKAMYQELTGLKKPFLDKDNVSESCPPLPWDREHAYTDDALELYYKVCLMDNLERIVKEVDHDDGKLIGDLLNVAEKNIDDSDEVIVAGDVISNPKQTFAEHEDNEEDDDDGDCVILDGDPDKPMAIGNNGGNDSGDLFAKHVDNEADDDDDDCVILDGDPNKAVAIENNGGNDSDDLCLVGEKGQVACRDYPHPRHLCVKFPFNSTPHEKHCDKCYCYVCDTVAPCVHWGNGDSSIDHCHATEKNAFWEADSKGAETSHKASPFVSKVGLIPVNQVPSLCSNPLMLNQELPTGQTCSVTGTGTPDDVMPMRTQESRGDPSNKFLPILIPYHLQRQSVGPAGTQLSPQHVPFKRPGTFGGILTTIRYLNSASRNNYGYQISANESLGSSWQDPRELGNQMLTTYECTKANSGGPAPNSVPNSSTGSPLGIGIRNYAPLHPQVYPHILSGSVNANSAAPYPQLSSQICMGSNLGNPMPTAPGVATQQRWGSHLANPMSLQPQAASQPNAYQNVVPAQQVVTSHGSINYPSKSPVDFYGEASMSQNSQSLPAESTQPISQTCMGDNLGNLMPVVATLQRPHYLCNPQQLPNEMSQNVVPTQPQVSSHGNAESPVTFMGKLL